MLDALRNRTLFPNAARAFAIALATALSPAWAQTAAAPPAKSAEAPPPAYDIMIIKPNKSASGSVDVDSNDERYSAHNVSLKNLLQSIYDIRQDLISGVPEPLESANFDLEAKIVNPDPDAIRKMTRDQRRTMLLPLLTERFNLKVHTETKTLPVYELVVAKGGPKFQPSVDQTKKGGGSTSTRGSRSNMMLTAHDLPMASLAKNLAGQVRRTVIDKTGLAGNFDLTLQWSPDDTASTEADSAPPIFTALQEQLGLKLEPAKGPVEILVVDHAELPTLD